MPYIHKNDRTPRTLVAPRTCGELNYAVTTISLAFLDFVKMFTNVPNKYEDYNAVIGALECAKQEMYRRMLVPYEDRKKKDNGDVYPC